MRCSILAGLASFELPAFYPQMEILRGSASVHIFNVLFLFAAGWRLLQHRYFQPSHWLHKWRTRGRGRGKHDWVARSGHVAGTEAGTEIRLGSQGGVGGDVVLRVSD